MSVACPSSYHASRGRLAARSVLRSAPRPVSRPVLLACLIRPCGPHRFIRSPFPRRLASFSSIHQLALCLVSPGSPSHRQAGRGDTIGERRTDGGRGHDCLLASWRWTDGGGCLPRMAMGGGRSSTADGCGRRAWLFACLGAIGGAARSFLDRFSFPIIGSSNRLGPGSSPSSHHLIDGGEGVFFSFSPDPLPPTLLGLLALACSPVPGRGMRGLRHGLRRRAGRLLACVLVSRAALSLPLVRSLLYALRRSCRSFLPGASLGVL